MTTVRMGQQISASDRNTRHLPPSPHRSWRGAEEQPARQLSAAESAALLQRLWAVIDGKDG